ncbi:unnamed protein product [Pleuronectes platessa]|uniref:Uncharacterized protein n=1 Tax=Pleuronectes platessa TaxID=8262 RepID=A0A9N7Y709_PLEPL|nr:unnamed protein product [Pleuronectes platessa]
MGEERARRRKGAGGLVEEGEAKGEGLIERQRDRQVQGDRCHAEPSQAESKRRDRVEETLDVNLLVNDVQKEAATAQAHCATSRHAAEDPASNSSASVSPESPPHKQNPRLLSPLFYKNREQSNKGKTRCGAGSVQRRPEARAPSSLPAERREERLLGEFHMQHVDQTNLSWTLRGNFCRGSWRMTLQQQQQQQQRACSTIGLIH